jgi:hypothetical protein
MIHIKVDEFKLVKIKYMEGLKYYILWVNCPHKDNIIKAYFKSKKEALEYVTNNNYKIVY